MAFRMNRASRIGPLGERNEGTALPISRANATWGFTRTRTPDGRLRMASATAVEVHGRPETIAFLFLLH